MTDRRPTLLCVLDGFGLNPNSEGNAVALANTKNFDQIWSEYPTTTLCTFGERVGLPAGQMGNSEVGHLNIGAGRVIEQWLLMISNKLTSNFLEESKEYQEFLENSADSENLHLIGLYSDGGVHSHCEHLKLFLEKISNTFSKNIFIHLITDGRDTSPKRSLEQIDDLESFLSKYPNMQIASVSGRYYAMDRDKRWDRTELAYQAIFKTQGPKFANAKECIKASYENDTTDEFVIPAVIKGQAFTKNDSVVFWNFRADRMRQLVPAICLKDFSEFDREFYLNKEKTLCFTNYHESFQLPHVFKQEKIVNHLGEVISATGLKQLRTAETEKYPHVTYFFNGLDDSAQPGEDRELIPSPRDVKTYNQKPEMSAFEVKDVVIKAIQNKKHDLIIVNFANCDMVGHTGDLGAAIKAVETVDLCLGEILENLKKAEGQAIIIADHGNAEQMINYEDNSPHTAHTTHPVPMIVFNAASAINLNEDGALCDIAPCILKLMRIDQPKEMTGQALF